MKSTPKGLPGGTSQPSARSSTARNRALSAAVAAIIATVAAVTAAAPAAQAAAPTCNRSGGWDIANGGRIYGPAYLPDSGQLPYQWACTLRYGAKGNAVLSLQDNINNCYFGLLHYYIDSDSSFGNQTRTALTAIQRHHGIAADGVYGPQTARAIRHHGWIWTPYGYYWAAPRCRSPDHVTRHSASQH
jgi:hypothetical protein